MVVRAMVVLLAVGVALTPAACGGSSDDGQARRSQKESSAERVPPAVTKFADQLQGCVDGEATGPTNYGGAVGAKQTGDLKAVATVEDSGANADFLVFRSQAEAEEASRALTRYRANGGKTIVRGLVLIAHKRPLGDLRCLETARRAAGPALPDPPPAPTPRLTGAQQQTAAKAHEVIAYCKSGDSTAFEYKDDAEVAVQQLIPLLEKAPDAEVQIPSGPPQTVRAIGAGVESALGDAPCLDPALTGELATAAP